MKRKWRTLLRPYQVALHRYLQGGSAASLQPALKLGRQAVALGLETLDLAVIHEQAVIAQVLPVAATVDRDWIIKRAGMFFAEAILPMEETHRTALEANVHLNRLNQELSQRTEDLSASNRKLRREITKRKTVEQALRTSEQHSGRLLAQSRGLQEQLRHLSRRILSTQEEERKRISRELHDVIAQMLTGINVRLATLKIEELMQELKAEYTIVIVTHNMQQAARVSDYTGMMMMRPDRAGEMIEFSSTPVIFTRPKDKRTEDYVTGRFG